VAVVLAAPTRSPVSASTIRLPPEARTGGLWLRPSTAVTLGPEGRIPPRIDDRAEVSTPPSLKELADKFAWWSLSVARVDSVLTGDIPWADRRLGDRLPVRPGSRTEIYRSGNSSGPDMAEELIDVSEAGVGVRLRTPVGRGARLNVTLWGPGAAWCGRGTGVVCWSVIGEGGTCLAGLSLSRTLTSQALRDLVAGPLPTPELHAEAIELSGLPDQIKAC
jgi:hypothetical protein